MFATNFWFIYEYKWHALRLKLCGLKYEQKFHQFDIVTWLYFMSDCSIYISLSESEKLWMIDRNKWLTGLAASWKWNLQLKEGIATIDISPYIKSSSQIMLKTHPFLIILKGDCIIFF